MGWFTRDDSPYYYLYLETTGKREPTRIRHDQPTPQLRKDALDRVRDLYHRRMLDVTTRDGVPLAVYTRTFREQAEWYALHVMPRHKGKDYEADILPRLVAAFGDLQLRDLTKARVMEWKSRLLTTPTEIRAKKRVKARTVQPKEAAVERMTDVLKAVMQSAVPEYLPASPLYGLKRLKPKTPRRTILKERDEQKVLDELADDDAALLVLGMDTLARLNDLLDIQWTHYDAVKRRIWIGDPKTGEGFYVPVSARARRYLAKLTPHADNPYLFWRRRVHEKATDKQRRNAVKQMLQRACKRAGVSYGRAKGGITFHWATRRTGATRMLSRGIPPGTVQKVGGWKTTEIVLNIYDEVQSADAARAVNAVAPRGKKTARHSRSVPANRKTSKS